MKRIAEKSKINRKQIVERLNEQKDGQYSIEIKQIEQWKPLLYIIIK